MKYIAILIHSSFYSHTGVYLHLKGKEHRNNSIISIQEIGTVDQEAALQCITDSDDCCRNEQIGEWIFPNGSTVPIEESGSIKNVIRNQNDQGSVSLNRGAGEVITPTGQYCCNVFDASDVFQILCANIG